MLMVWQVGLCSVQETDEDVLQLMVRLPLSCPPVCIARYSTAHLLHRDVCLSSSLTGLPSPRKRQQTRSGSSEAALKVRRLQARLSTNLGSSSQRLRKEGAGAGARARDPTCGVTLPGPDEYFPGEYVRTVPLCINDNDNR
jgi:hypothetical protein